MTHSLAPGFAQPPTLPQTLNVQTRGKKATGAVCICAFRAARQSDGKPSKGDFRSTLRVGTWDPRGPTVTVQTETRPTVEGDFQLAGSRYVIGTSLWLTRFKDTMVELEGAAVLWQVLTEGPSWKGQQRKAGKRDSQGWLPTACSEHTGNWFGNCDFSFSFFFFLLGFMGTDQWVNILCKTAHSAHGCSWLKICVSWTLRAVSDTRTHTCRPL